jgi:predicted GIY-YIG superfamily endonuclease
MGRPFLDRKPGVYIIKHKNTERVYIGSSINMYSRIYCHKNKLKNNRHTNPKLQNFCNKHGFEGFIFEVKEFCEKEKLIEREQYWMDYYKSYTDNGFNVSKIASYPYKDLTMEEIQKRRSIFAEKVGRCLFAYDKNHIEYLFPSISECSRQLKISDSKICEVLNNKDYHKEFLFSDRKLSKEEIVKYFTISCEHYKEVKVKSIENLEKTGVFINNESINIHISEILSFEICDIINNKVKSSFVYHKDTKNLTSLRSIKFSTNKYLYAPTQSVLAKWLREVHGIEVYVKPFYIPQLSREGCFKYYGLVTLKECIADCSVSSECKDKYEDAFEEALVLGLNMIKI